MTRPPRMFAGEFSAEQTGTVTSLRPIPIPSKIRHATSWPQCWVHAEPKGASRLKIAPRKIVPLRPRRLLIGSEIQPALFFQCISISDSCPWSVEDDLQECDGNVRARVNEPDKPRIL